jgi:hypothetical protein
MKKLLTLFFILTSCYQIQAQVNNGTSYKTALGAKFYPGAISVKHFVKPARAIEGLGYISNEGFRITGLYELHFPITGAEGLAWYVGGGAHIGAWNDNWRNRYPTRNSSIALGVDGVLGLDYKIKGAPLNLSFDWQPSFNLIGYTYFEGGWGGLAIRYTF